MPPDIDDTGIELRPDHHRVVTRLFVPGIEPGVRYKFRVLGQDGRWRPHREYCFGTGEADPPTSHRRR